MEDDRPVRNLIVTTLKTHDYKYLTAENGNEAVMEAASHNPDIILLDLGLPDMDGIEVIKRIRTWSNMPIIVISARSEESDKIEALDAGADDYLTKPFSVEELLARLRVTERRLKLMRSGTEAYVYYAADMGKQLGKGYRIAPGIYGDTTEKTGDRSWLCAVYPDPYRYRLPHAAGRLI